MDPIRLFRNWYNEWLATSPAEPSAMALSTADRSGNVSSRMVLMKGFDEQGFVFYTSYTSRKGQQMAENRSASLLFWWQPLGRQVRIEGRVERISREASAEYFRTRTAESRIGAWASEQSTVIGDRSELERRVRYFTELFAGEEISLPPSWGGYRLIPSRVEFWQEGQHRLHHRTLYRLTDNKWIKEILAP